jgi:hypothetical protein
MLFWIRDDNSGGDSDTWLTVESVDEAVAWVFDTWTMPSVWKGVPVGLLPIVAGTNSYVLFGVTGDGTLVPTGYRMEKQR